MTLTRPTLPEVGVGTLPEAGVAVVPRAPAVTGPGASRVRPGRHRTRPRRVPALRPLAALAGGGLLDAAFPPLGWWWLAPLGVAVATLAVRGTRGRAAYGLGLLTGAAWTIPLLTWVRAAGIDAWLALAVSQALLLGLIGPLSARLQRGAWWVLTVPGVWVLVEGVRSRVPFGGFPWGRVAFSQPGSSYVRWAAIGGAPLVTAAVVLSGLALAAAGVGRRPQWVAAAVLPPLIALAVPVPTGGQRTPGGRSDVVVAAVQGNVPRLGLGFDAQRRAVLDRHVQATVKLAEAVRAGRVAAPDIVLWPENGSDLDPFTEADARQALDTAARAIDRPILVGAIIDGPGPTHVSNTALVWTPSGPTGERYVKRHPVPFAEYVPLRSVLGKLIGRFSLVPRDFAAGHDPGVLDVGPVRLADVICYEVAYDGLVRDAVTRGTSLLVVQTNNATFRRSAESAQQLAMVRLRAVEHGRAAVMVSTSGESALVEPDGHVVMHSGMFVQAELVARLPLRTSTTVADHLGWWPELVLSLLGLGAAVRTVRLRRLLRSGRRPRRVPLRRGQP